LSWSVCDAGPVGEPEKEEEQGQGKEEEEQEKELQRAGRQGRPGLSVMPVQ